MGETPTPETKKDALDDAVVIRMLHDQLDHAPTDEQIAQAHRDPAVQDRIGDWITVVEQVAADAAARVEARGDVAELGVDISALNRQFRHDFGTEGQHSPVTIEAAKALCRAVLAVLEKSSPEKEQAA